MPTIYLYRLYRDPALAETAIRKLKEERKISRQRTRLDKGSTIKPRERPAKSKQLTYSTRTHSTVHEPGYGPSRHFAVMRNLLAYCGRSGPSWTHRNLDL